MEVINKLFHFFYKPVIFRDKFKNNNEVFKNHLFYPFKTHIIPIISYSVIKFSRKFK